jgi:hypothetical protein
MKKRCDRVIFRRWKAGDGGGVIALFPDQPEGRGRVNSYEHVGQHGAADYPGLLRRTKPAKPAEYKDLLRELKHIGYSPCVVRKRTR